MRFVPQFIIDFFKYYQFVDEESILDKNRREYQERLKRLEEIKKQQESVIDNVSSKG